MRELHPVCEFFPPLTEDEYASLRESIAEHGVLVAAKIDAEGRIVDGRHRARAADELGIDYDVEPLPEGTDPWSYARTVNLDRRHLTPQQKVAVLKRAEMRGEAPEVERIREQAKENVGGRPSKTAPQERQGSGKRSDDEVGALVGVSGDTVRRVEEAVATAEKVGDDPERIVTQIAAGERTAQEYVREKNDELGTKIKQLAGPPTPVWDAWWKAVGTLMQKAKVADLDEEWDADQNAKIEEWTAPAIARLEKIRDAAQRPANLRSIEGGGGRGGR